MTMIARDLINEWGFDAATRLTPAMACALATTPLNARPLTFCWRYVSFHTPFAGDLDHDELNSNLDAGLTQLVVQHVRKGPWEASGLLGRSDGQWAAKNATAAGYLPGMSLNIACDLENVVNVGGSVIDHVNEWCLAVSVGGYRPVLYVGFDCGLTPDQLFHTLIVDRYWSDAADRQVAVRGTCCIQGPQIMHAGVLIDSDHARPDALGGRLTGLALVA